MNNFQLEQYLNELLRVDRYKDYAPNGLQVEGRAEVKKVICGVTASQELINDAINKKADAILVHHGYFWKGEQPVITGIKQRRIHALLTHGINLYGYHLPLDGHEVLGNNAQLAKLWGIERAQPIAPFELIWTGRLPTVSVDNFKELLKTTLDREPLVIKAGDKPISKVAWCSGGAQGFLEQAASLGVDAYVSGEASEKTYHEAKEYGVHYFGAGHHATERGGIQALSSYLCEHQGLDCEFIDLYNPI